MTSWRQVLRDSDPGMERMDADAAARMREAVIRAARSSTRSTAAWPVRFALAAFACVVTALSILGTQRPVDVAPEPAGAVSGTERRQVQFATPGGTRIIWEINPNFTLGETVP